MANLEELLSKEVLAEVKACGQQMDAATNGEITIAAKERVALPPRSAAVIEYQRQQALESERGI